MEGQGGQEARPAVGARFGTTPAMEALHAWPNAMCSAFTATGCLLLLLEAGRPTALHLVEGGDGAGGSGCWRREGEEANGCRQAAPRSTSQQPQQQKPIHLKNLLQPTGAR